MKDHLTFEQLCDMADGALDPSATDAAQQHLVSCEACAVQLRGLSQLEHAAASLPRSVAPPDELWSDIREQLASRRSGRRSKIAAWGMPQLAAAGLVVAVGSSALTALVMRSTRPESAVAPRVTAVAPAPVTALPERLASAEDRYTRNINLLQLTLAERRDSLAPSTVATVEHSLRIADSAIAEARAALARDPANSALAELFTSNYERKIDVLRRATELAPRT